MNCSMNNSSITSEPFNITSKSFETSSQPFLSLEYIICISLGVIILIIIVVLVIYKLMKKHNYVIADSSDKPEDGSIQIYSSHSEQSIVPHVINHPVQAPVQPIVTVEESPEPEEIYFHFPTPTAKSNPYGYVPMTPPPAVTPSDRSAPPTPPYYVNMHPNRESQGSSSGYVPMSPRIEATTSIPRIISCPLPPLPVECLSEEPN